MECNKDEAKRAMDIADRKLTEKDYIGAKKFATKAQNLFPDLEDLKQLFMIINVYIAGENKISGVDDWYGVLNVTPTTGDEAVKKQYRKLALLLHPDKSRFKSAEGAFKLVQEAWNILSDSFKRYAYIQSRQVKNAPQRFTTTQNGVPPHQPTSRARARPKPAATRMDRSRTGSSDVPLSAQGASTTFWTICNQCNTQYEYLRVYLNQSLLCPNCHTPFKAVEKTPPENVPKPVIPSSNQQRRNSKTQASDKNFSRREPVPSVNHNFQRDSSSGMAGSFSRNATNQAANVGQQAQDRIRQQAQERLKRGFVESQEMDAAREFTNSDLRNFKRVRADDLHMRGLSAGHLWTQGGAFSTSNPANGNTVRPNTAGSRHPHIPGMVLPCDITKALMHKAQSDIFKRLPKMVADMMETKVKATEGEKKSVEATSKMISKAIEVERPVEKIPVDSNDVKDDDDNDEVKEIVVPDSDFHNFDLDRSENSFKDDQIWAAYDTDDGMPRFYARIQKVISLKPFKMKISWLNSRSTSEFSPIVWVDSGFAKSCGDFRVGRYESTDTLNAFSHKVDFTKGVKGLLHILPKKGQVWALYRNWSPDWNKDTPDEVVHKYEMVEVLDNYTEDSQSVTVTLLLKAEGFKAVFRRSTNEKDRRKIVKEEMFRFSHQVPHYILTGKEADNALEGCLELDPAAIPCEFFSGNAEANEKSETVKEKSSVTKEKEAGMDLD